MNDKKPILKRRLRITFEFDVRFITPIPSIHINLHTSTLELNWIMFGVYIDYTY